MIADMEGFMARRGPGGAVVLLATDYEPLASIVAVAKVAEAVGNLAMECGMGQPLASFQKLVAIYQKLTEVQAALCATAMEFLAGPPPSPSEK